MPEDHFGEEVAAQYDAAAEHDPMFSAEAINPVVDLLVELARDGRALELGIGTGRIALPLAERGVPVHGIDLSEAMVARLRAKPGAEQDRRHDRGLRDDEGGRHVHGRVPRLQHDPEPHDAGRPGRVLPERRRAPGARRLLRDRGRATGPERCRSARRSARSDLSESHLGFDEYDVANQGLISHHYTRDADGRFEYSSGPFRYVWPSELDLMARIAGLTPRERWSGWKREPFTSVSEKLVGVWEKPAS